MAVVRFHVLASSPSRRISGQGSCLVSIQDTETSMYNDLFAPLSRACSYYSDAIRSFRAAHQPVVQL